MELPADTIYVKGSYKAYSFENALCAKGETIPYGGRNIDWFYASLNQFEHWDTAEFVEHFEDMRDNGKAYPIGLTEQRDGCFEETDLFLVYQYGDLMKLEELIRKAKQEATLERVPSYR